MLSLDLAVCVAIYSCIESYKTREKPKRCYFVFSDECELCPSI